MHVIASGSTSVGRRTNNEDALCLEPQLGLYVVADGMGGYEGGEVASALAIDAIRGFVADNRRDPDGTWPIKERRTRTYEENLLDAATVKGHQSICARRQGVLRGMGSTVVAALVTGSRLTVAHVGDSRCYRLRQGQLEALTVDHSVWAEMRAAGLANDRANFPYRNQITRALGITDNFGVEVSSFDLLPGDRVLLCSDGLYDPLDDEALANTLARDDAADALPKLAFDQGSTDNITCVVLTVTRQLPE